MRYAMLINPESGRRQGQRIGEVARSRLVDAGHEVVVVEGEDMAAGRDQLRQSIDAGADRVVVVGGDGALHGVLPMIVHAGVPVGLLPTGSGNDAARALGIPHRDAEAATQVLLDDTVRTIDLANVDGQLVVTVVASGFDSKVNERANQMTWPHGNLRYNLAMLAELRAFEPLAFTLTLDDGQVLRRRAMLVAVGNGPSFGGGLRICEGAVLDDGLLDVVVVNPVSKLKLLRVFPELYRGTHVRRPEVERHLVRAVTLESADIVAYGDGERLGPLPRRVEVAPSSLRVIAPA